MSAKAVIKLQDCKIYQRENLVLKNISMEVQEGEFVYLIGKTGSGKSSLLRTLYAELPLQEGQGQIVDFDLRKIKSRDIPYLRRKIGIIFQDFQLLTDRNVHDNLLFVLKATGWKDKNKMGQRIEEVLSMVGMKTKAFKMPFQLSGGEQQRVAIARALLNKPELIIADEPTGNLDPSTSLDLMKLLLEISAQGQAILMSTHDYALILKYPQRTLRVDDSTLTEVEQKTT